MNTPISHDDERFFDVGLHRDAAQTVEDTITHALTGPPALRDEDRNQHVTMLDSAAGAGKTRAVVDSIEAACRAGARVLVATPNNAQLSDLGCKVANRVGSDLKVVVLHRKGPWEGETALEGYDLTTTDDVADTADADVVLSTVKKVASVGEKMTQAGNFDLAVVDEGYQASANDAAWTIRRARRVLVVGDDGQLKPFTTDPTHNLTGHIDDPVLSLGHMLDQRHGPNIAAAGGRHTLPLTRRLPATAEKLLSRFYPREVRAWTRPAARQAQAPPGGPASQASSWVWGAIGRGGWTHVTLPAATTDPEADLPMARAVAYAAAAAVQDGYQVYSETTAGRWEPLAAHRIAVLVTYQQQRRQVQSLLADLLPDRLQPVVGTANTLQGAEFDATIVWHPLAGAAEFNTFRGDTGRLAVMLSRHRHGCVVVGRDSDRDLFEHALPPLGQWDGTPADTATSGWLTHRAVFTDLQPFNHPVCTIEPLETRHHTRFAA